MRLYKHVRALETTKNSDLKDGPEITDISQKLEATIRESKLFFSHPASFNDPLECTIPVEIENYDATKEKYAEYYKKIINEGLGTQHDESERSRRIYEAFEYGMPLENCLITCFTKDGNNQLMWSHYADQNKGICLCYEFPDTIEEFKKHVKWSGSINFDMNKFGLEVQSAFVTYQTKRPSLHISNTYLPVEKWTFDNDYVLKNAVFTKPEYWKYEYEWRLALILPFGSEKAFSAGINTSDYYAELPREWLKEVTFGLRLKKEHCEKIKKIFEKSSYSSVEFKKVKLAHAEFRTIIGSY